MQGPIAQIVALTMHGNSLLQGKSDGASFQEINTTCRFCESVLFQDAGTRAGPVWAANVHEWFGRLKREGVRSLRLRHGPSGRTDVADRILVAFGGGGRWFIETGGDARPDYWISRWVIGNRERKDKKIWRVSYLRIPGEAPIGNGTAEDLAQLKAELRTRLEEIAEFSRCQKLDSFTKLFESGIARLESQAPLEGIYHSDIAPPRVLPLAASQLLGAVEAAWVFGGMGSWNDQGFERDVQSRYEKVSEQLYQIINRVIVAAANSSVSFD
jgi:hypothetical protein